MEVSRLACCEVVHDFCNHDFPEVLSMRCFTLGCGRFSGDVSRVHARIDPAMRMMAIAYSRSLMDISGLWRESFVFFLISSGHG